jgi:hypothetical protein
LPALRWPSVRPLAGAASAHHGFNVEFDGTKCLDLKGTLTGVIWENPHAYLQMDVKDAAAARCLAPRDDHAERPQA